jgi:hypothetical protein
MTLILTNQIWNLISELWSPKIGTNRWIVWWVVIPSYTGVVGSFPPPVVEVLWGRWHVFVSCGHFWTKTAHRTTSALEFAPFEPNSSQTKFRFWVGNPNLAENKLLVVIPCLVLLCICVSMCCLWQTWCGILFMRFVNYVTCCSSSFDTFLIPRYAKLITMLCCYFNSSKCVSLASTEVLIGIPNPNILQVSLV